MKKFLQRFFLLAFVLLLLGQSVMMAFGQVEADSYASRSMSENGAGITAPGFGEYILSAHGHMGLHSEKLQISVSENEEEDLDSIKKYMEISAFFLAVLSFLIPTYFRNYIKEHLPLCKHFSHLSSFRYLKLRVLII